MPSLAFSILIALCMVLAAVIAIRLSLSPRFAGKARAPHRMKAEQQFSSYRAELTGSAGTVDGQTAQVLSKTESLSFYNFKVHNYVLTVIGVSPEGQHFLFKSNEEGPPYVKLISEKVAIRQPKGKPWSRAGDA